MKRLETYITTSWDDGNPSDLRVAELTHSWQFTIPRGR